MSEPAARGPRVVAKVHHLAVFEPDRPTRRVTLTDRPLLLGRAPDCDVVLADDNVSRRHAIIEPDLECPGRHRLRDLDSTNGTQVGGKPVTGWLLRAGDLIALGGVRIRACHGADRQPGAPLESRAGRPLQIGVLWHLHCQLRTANHLARQAERRHARSRREFGLTAHRQTGLDLAGGELAELLEQMHACSHSTAVLETAIRHSSPAAPHLRPNGASAGTLTIRLSELATALGDQLAERITAGRLECPSGCASAWRELRRARSASTRARRRLERARHRYAAPPPAWLLRSRRLAPPILTAATMTLACLQLLGRAW